MAGNVREGSRGGSLLLRSSSWSFNCLAMQAENERRGCWSGSFVKTSYQMLFIWYASRLFGWWKDDRVETRWRIFLQRGNLPCLCRAAARSRPCCLQLCPVACLFFSRVCKQGIVAFFWHCPIYYFTAISRASKSKTWSSSVAH